jgi:hypothetical protein
MKITVDGILGSAQKINSKKKTDETELKQDKKDIKPDSVKISRIINSRIETIEKEVKEIQTSLTKNQIIGEGIDRLISASTPDAVNKILNETTFNNERILRDFMGSSQSFSSEFIAAKKNEVKSLITDNMNSLTKIQVEMDNIIASDLTGTKKVENIMAEVNDTLKKTPSGLGNISNLDADKVRKLIR